MARSDASATRNLFWSGAHIRFWVARASLPAIKTGMEARPTQSNNRESVIPARLLFFLDAPAPVSEERARMTAEDPD
jgi:hypothetical protein